MFDGHSILAVIPARGGSKGLPGKNIRLLAGKPLLAWTIEAARASGVIDEIVVSTDSPEIAAVATACGCAPPFWRPEELAGDTSPTMAALWHALDWYAQQQDRRFDLVLLLQPTSPLRQAADILAALELLRQAGVSSVVSVCPVDHHPLWSNTLPPDHSLEHFLRPEALRPRQELPPSYRLNGAIYLARTDWLRERGSFLGPGAYALVMPRQRSVDIDDATDFLLAEILLKHNPSAP